MMTIFANPQTYVSLLVLTALEIVLGIDNVLFVSIVANKLPKDQRLLARRIGLSLALFGRLVLLVSLSYVAHLREPLFSFLNFSFSGRDIVLLLGGLFLLYKSTQEIFGHMEGQSHAEMAKQKIPSFRIAIVQIIILDIVFSLDSIITAIGLVSHISIMAIAVTISMFIMLFFSNTIGDFIDLHPSMKLLGLAFLLVVSVLLIAESFGHEIPKGYVYFALAFSLTVELINIRHQKVNTAKSQR